MGPERQGACEWRRSRTRCLAALVLVVAAGLGSRSGSALVSTVLAEHAGDALWTVAVYLSLAFVRPNARAATLLALALAISFTVEWSQRFDPDWLVALRRHPLGRLFVGQGWVALDLARYTVGGLLAWSLDRLLRPSD